MVSRIAVKEPENGARMDIDLLRRNYGKTVKVYTSERSGTFSRQCTLLGVEDSQITVVLEIGETTIPFISRSSAISRIIDTEGAILFINPAIPEQYHPKSQKEISDLLSESGMSFAETVARALR